MQYEYVEVEKPKKTEMNVPAVLRRLGTIILVAAGAAFLIEGWHRMSTTQWYLYFLAFSSGLAGMGIFCGTRLQEPKSARNFLALATATATVHFAQLGGALYGGSTVSFAPGWQLALGDAVSTGLLSTIAIALFTPLAYLGFSSLRRGQGKVLGTGFFILNALLLFPVRQGNAVGLIIALAIAVFLILDVGFLQRDSHMKSGEGLFARLIALLPVAVMIGRTMMYENNNFVYGFILIAAGGVLFGGVPRWFEKRPGTAALQHLSMPLFFSGWSFIVSSFPIDRWPGDQLTFIYCLPMAALAYLLSFFMDRQSGFAYRGIAGYFTTLVVGLIVLGVGGVTNTAVGVSAAVALIGAGAMLKERHSLIGGTIILSVSLLRQVGQAFQFAIQSPWLSLGVVGFLVLLAAVYMEKNGATLNTRLDQFRKRMAEWR